MRDNQLRQNAATVHQQIEQDKQIDARMSQEKDMIVKAIQKLREDPKFFDNKPEALQAFNTLLSKHKLPNFNGSNSFGIGNGGNLNSGFQSMNAGMPQNMNASNQPTQPWRYINGFPKPTNVPGHKTSSGLATPYGTKNDQLKQNNGMLLHSFNL